MSIPAYSAATANEAWLWAHGQLLGNGEPRVQSGRGGTTRELLHVHVEVLDPRQRWCAGRGPALNPGFALADVLWILAGRSDSRFLTYFNSQLSKFAGKTDNFHGAYGFRLRNHFGVDQLVRAYSALRANPDTRQMLFVLYDPAADQPAADGNPVASDIPCNVCSLLKVREGRLEWLQVCRSNDLFLGIPHNFIQFTTIQEVLAGWLGVEVGSYHHVSDSLHLYDHDLLTITAERDLSVPLNDDSLALEQVACDRLVMEMCRVIDELIGGRRPPDLSALECCCDAPAWRNMMCVIVAEVARRRSEFEAVTELMGSCGNELYRLLWERWVQRLSDASDTEATAR